MSCNSNTFLDVRHSLLQSNFEIRFIIQLQNLEGCRGPSPAGIIHAPTKCHRPPVRPRPSAGAVGADEAAGSISHTGREGGDALNDRKRASDRIQVNSIQRSQHSADRQMAEECKMQRQAKETYGFVVSSDSDAYSGANIIPSKMKCNHSAAGGRTGRGVGPTGSLPARRPSLS